MNKKILLIGGGGHCKSVLETLLETKIFLTIGIIDKVENIGKKILGIPVVDSDDNLEKLFLEGYEYAFISLGSIGNPEVRIKLFKKIQSIGFEIPNIIDSSSVVGKNTKFGSGIFVGKNAVINVGTVVKNGAIINTSSTIEHDCVIGKFAHIAPGAVLSGAVKIGENTHIGANSTIKQLVEIGDNSLVGMGSVVLTNIGDNVVAYGNPCKVVK